ncbi:30S ribosomal protein S15, partial [Grifola frondosa]
LDENNDVDGATNTVCPLYRVVQLPRAASLHTTAVLSSARRRKSRVAESANNERRAERERKAQIDRPHIILGNRPNDEAKWQNCDLAKVLVTLEEITTSPAPSLSFSATGELQLPSYYNYGIGEAETEMLFEVLPALTVEGWNRTIEHMDDPRQRIVEQSVENREMLKSKMLARLVDLRNANARGIAYENRKRIVAEFSEPEKPGDTGRPEVQAALLTMKIRNLWDHLSRVKKDVANRRSLRFLVHQRAKILKYLKGVDRARYDRILQRLGLEPESIEGELVV